MNGQTTRRRTIIVGAAGRDFHDFNVVFRGDPTTEVVAFTAAQIPGISGRRYPAVLAGPLYPDGIPIEDEARLADLCRESRVQQVVFAYSDVPHDVVMHVASKVIASGADFVLLGPSRTWLSSKLPVIAVSAARTGCGKSQTARAVSATLRARGLRAVVLRHPMPYGDLARQSVQRFASLADLEAADCTAEEREEYEPHIAEGNVVYAGVDYAAILAEAEAEADVLIWDGGNNDFPFLRPDFHVAIADALRPSHTSTHHPGEAVLRMADVIVINKVNVAKPEDVALALEGAQRINPRASIVRAASPVKLDDEGAVRGRRALVVEDGPTTTHGGMSYGAGYVAALAGGASEIVDPRASATPELQAVFERYPHIGRVLPAMGYGKAQLDELRSTIEGSSADVVVAATPIDLASLLHLTKPVVRARYAYADAGDPTLGSLINAFLTQRGLGIAAPSP